ncbi:hypothetical protein SBA4_860028 [Candidatus Sulfopaludibacter sp. SbA4]|nr:hypothetical protein SBA4_860028 [Candidatus Sulfopaludibacter sp. SbA4]
MVGPQVINQAYGRLISSYLGQQVNVSAEISPRVGLFLGIKVLEYGRLHCSQAVEAARRQKVKG